MSTPMQPAKPTHPADRPGYTHPAGPCSAITCASCADKHAAVIVKDDAKVPGCMACSLGFNRCPGHES